MRDPERCAHNVSEEFALNMFHRLSSSLLAIVALSLCARASSSASKVYEDSELAKAPYSNFLVVGVAGGYDGRAQFEREVVTKLESMGRQAAAFHSVVGGEQPVNRETVRQALAESLPGWRRPRP